MLKLFNHALQSRSLRTGDNNSNGNHGCETCRPPARRPHVGPEGRSSDDGPNLTIDLAILDCGTGSPLASYKTGVKSERRARYNARFIDLPEDEMCYPSYGATGSKNKEAKILHKRITIAIASANPSVHVSVIGSQVMDPFSELPFETSKEADESL